MNKWFLHIFFLFLLHSSMGFSFESEVICNDMKTFLDAIDNALENGTTKNKLEFNCKISEALFNKFDAARKGKDKNSFTRYCVKPTRKTSISFLMDDESRTFMASLGPLRKFKDYLLKHCTSDDEQESRESEDNEDSNSESEGHSGSQDDIDDVSSNLLKRRSRSKPVSKLYRISGARCREENSLEGFNFSSPSTSISHGKRVYYFDENTQSIIFKSKRKRGTIYTFNGDIFIDFKVNIEKDELVLLLKTNANKKRISLTEEIKYQMVLLDMENNFNKSTIELNFCPNKILDCNDEYLIVGNEKD